VKAAELKDLTVEELSRKAGELRENLFNLKIRRRAGTLESVSDVTKNKRDLARILTLLTLKNGSSKAARKQAPGSGLQAPGQKPAAEKKEST
jgi:large subunit ribosomal protein L29